MENKIGERIGIPVMPKVPFIHSCGSAQMGYFTVGDVVLNLCDHPV